MPIRSADSMPEPNRSRPLKLCLVGDDELVTAVVRAVCPPPHEIRCFSIEQAVDVRRGLTGVGVSIVEVAATADALLITWALETAPVFNTICFHVRAAHRIPILALCGAHPDDHIAALAAGADDFLMIPFLPALIQMKTLAYRRLVTAVEAAGRNEQPPSDFAPEPSNDPGSMRLGELRLDRRAHKFFVKGREMPLTMREFKLLEYLMEHTDEACSRDQILDAVWGINFDTGTNMVDVYMYFLRKKLAAHGVRDAIQTLRGLGYRFTAGTTA